MAKQNTVTLVRIQDHDSGETRVMTMREFAVAYGELAEDILSGIIAGKTAIRYYLSADMAKNFGKGRNQ